MKPGQKILYAAHPVSWQDTGEPLPTGKEDWREAELLALTEARDLTGHLVDAQIPQAETLARVQPADGSPAFELDARLVKPA